MTNDNARLTVAEKVGYGVGDLASNLFWMMFIFYLLYFYTDVFGISAVAAGTMLLITRTADTFIDPVIGMIADRTKTRWGRFRPYLFWMAVPFGIVGVLTFTTPGFDATGKLIWAYVTYSLMMLVYSGINIPYSALMGVVTSDSLERTKLSTYRFVCAFLGGVIVQWATVPLKRMLGGGNEQLGYQLTAAIYAVMAVALFLYTFSATKERVQPVKEQKTPLKRDLWDLTKNRPWMVLFVAGLCSLTFNCVRNSSLMYYFKYFVGDEGLAPNFMMAGTLANIAGVLATGWLTKRFGKKNLYLLCMVTAGIITALYYLAGPTNLPYLYVLNIVGGFLSGPPAPLIWAMYADAADYSEWRTGRRATGLVFSAASFGQKMGWTLGGTIAAWLLAYYGFQANLQQAPDTLHGIVLLMSFIPAALTVLAGLSMLFYTIDEGMLKRIQQDLADRRKEQQTAALPV